MRERQISYAEVAVIAEKLVNVVIYPSAKDTAVDLFFGKVDRAYLLVVINREEKSIITVRPMSKKEKCIYKEHFHEKE